MRTRDVAEMLRVMKSDDLTEFYYYKDNSTQKYRLL